jgi:putative Mg2+ transporter-C (MgtC) family protein
VTPELCVATLAELTDTPLFGSHRAELFIRLLSAGVMGGLLGWERSRSEKPADTRTMVLVAVGAAGFAALGIELMNSHDTGETIRTDPTRVLSYIISGVGFLGAGAILHSKKAVRGLTTASAIWAVAAIGAACGVGEIELGVSIFVIVFGLLWSNWITHALLGPDEEENGRRNEEGNDQPPPAT